MGKACPGGIRDGHFLVHGGLSPFRSAQLSGLYPRSGLARLLSGHALPRHLSPNAGRLCPQVLRPASASTTTSRQRRQVHQSGVFPEAPANSPHFSNRRLERDLRDRDRPDAGAMGRDALASAPLRKDQHVSPRRGRRRNLFHLQHDRLCPRANLRPLRSRRRDGTWPGPLDRHRYGVADLALFLVRPGAK